MEQAFDPQSLPAARAERYRQLAGEIGAVLAGEANRIARMATIAGMLAASFEEHLWTGFYIVDADRRDELVVGPYQGSLGCLRIAFGRGVCGAAAKRRATIIVPDVSAFEGHIACDSRSRSEIVVPVLDACGELLGVLDIDAAHPNAFDETDARGLEEIVRLGFAD